MLITFDKLPIKIAENYDQEQIRHIIKGLPKDNPPWITVVLLDDSKERWILWPGGWERRR